MTTTGWTRDFAGWVRSRLRALAQILLFQSHTQARPAVLGLFAVIACGAGDERREASEQAPHEQVGEMKAALSTTVTEDFSSGTPGGPWPSRWKTLAGGQISATIGTAAFSTTGNLGVIAGNSGSSMTRYLTAPSLAVDSDQSLNIALTTGNGNLYGGLISRINSPSLTSSYYGLLVGQLTPSRLRFYKSVNGVYTQLGSLASITPAFGVSTLATSDSWYRVRFKTTQVNPTQTLLQVKLWQGTEPSGWTLEYVDSEPLLQGVAGYEGIVGSINSGNTRSLVYDDYVLASPLAPGACSTNSDCSNGLFCSQAGECRLPGATCSSDQMCGVAQVCNAGECACPASAPACVPPGGPSPTLPELMAGFPALNYRRVTYARETSDYFVWPTPTPFPATSALVSPELQRSNRFIFTVPAPLNVTLHLDVGNTSAPSNPPVDVVVYDAAGAVIWKSSFESLYQNRRQRAINLGSLAAGNYEFNVVAQDPTLTYNVSIDAGITLALKGGADLAQATSNLYFVVPAEVETAFLLGQFDTANPVQFFSPDGTAVTPTAVTSRVYSLDTRGKPGVWRTNFRTTSSRAHFVNLPDLFSFDPNAVVMSKRIRTAMESSTGGASVAVTSPNLKYNNRFAFHVASASAPSFLIGNGTRSTAPTPITVSLLDAKGALLSGSPLDITPNGTPQPLSAGTLQPGDYELHVKNSSIYNSYSIRVPPGIPFVSVDGYGLGSVWLPSHRAFFTVPAGTTSVRFAAKPTGVPIDLYNAAGAFVGAPTSLGNNVYEIPNTTPGTWGINLTGEHWSDIRLLNVPQIISFDAALLQTVAPGPTQCTNNAACSGGETCQNGVCTCGSPTSCSSTCHCSTDGGCAQSSDCLYGLSCVSGTCQDCTQVGCNGATCSSSSDCAPDLVCAAGQCRPSCALEPSAPDCVQAQCFNGVRDGAETDVDCGGGCTKCTSSHLCNSDTDCDAGLACGTNNGGYFGLPRSTRVCWPKDACENGVDSNECGQESSVCGKNCGGVSTCDIANPACPPGEVCKSRLGQLFGLDSVAVCTDPSCPSSNPDKCGTTSSLCGIQCVCTPDCSTATAANPSDHCGGVCPHLCGMGQACCTTDLNCPVDSFCQAQANGPGVCRPSECAFQQLAPPLCGSSNSLCGQQCRECTPECDGRQCGLDTACGVSCGTCGGGTFCNGSGQCVAPTSDPPPLIKDSSGGTSPLPNLPEGPATPVGAVAGHFSVSEQGTAQYNIPIQVPPGRAGIEPTLSLRYSAGKANGDVGVGWKLEGLSQITRCPRVHALDGYAAPVKNDPSDRFCLDGKRLETVPGSEPYGTADAEYRTLVDTFNKVVSRVSADGGFQPPQPDVPQADRSAQGPDYFEVWTKDGRKLTYGRTRESLLMRGNGVRVAWLLNRVEDRMGNSETFRYSNLLAEVSVDFASQLPNVVQPKAIFYTGHGSTEGDREVRFDYEERLDGRMSFGQGGIPLLTRARLKRVITYVKGRPIKNYRLDYKNPLSQVEAITECLQDGDVCKPSTKFEYRKESGFTEGGGTPTVGGTGQLDVNNDGIPDFLVTTVHVGDVAANPWLTAGAVTADLAVEGASYVYLTPIGGVALNTIWGLAKGPLFGLFAAKPKVTFTHQVEIGTGSRLTPFSVADNVQGIGCPTGNSVLMDWDQDGKDDIVTVCSPDAVKAFRSLGDGNFAQVGDGNIATLPQRDPNDESPYYPVPDPIIYDVNGDSLQDLVSCGPFGLQIRLRLPTESGSGFEEAISVVPAASHFEGSQPFCADGIPTYRVFDLDGDGTPELLARFAPRFSPPQDGTSSDGNATVLYGEIGWYALRFSRLNGVTDVHWQRVDLPDTGNSASGEGMLLGDLNGDGLNDIWRADGAEATIWLNNGIGFTAGTHSRPRPALDLQPRAQIDASILIDHDADGRLDILEHWQSQPDYFKFNAAIHPNGRMSRLDATSANDVSFFSPTLNFLVPGSYSNVGDVDGDGNPDLFGVDAIYYGSGVHNLLLSRVQDGLGNVVHVYYDTEPFGTGAYTATCSEARQWPEKCLKNMRGLVSAHTEGFVSSNSAASDVIEREYTYGYENGRVNLTGHGWLGFDKRTIVEKVLDQERRVTIEFEPVARYSTLGTPAVSLLPPYLYPLAGMVRSTTIDEGSSDLSANQSPLESEPRTRRTRTKNRWKVKLSNDSSPFPYLAGNRTDSFSRPTQLPLEQDGDLRTSCIDDNKEIDGYANVKHNVKTCGNYDLIDLTVYFEKLDTTVTFDTNREQWVISNPGTTTLQKTRGDNTQTQVFLSQYDAAGLLSSVTRDPDGEAQRIVYGRDALGFGNIERIVEVAPGSSPAESPRVTDIKYDGDNLFPKEVWVYPTEISEEKAHVTQVRYEPGYGQVASVVDPNGIPLQYKYDGFGKRIEAVSPSGVTTFEYQALPFASVSLTPAGRIHPRLRITSLTHGTEGSFGGRVEQELDYNGRVVRTSSVGFGGVDVISEQAFDARGRLTGATAPHLGGAAVVPTVEYAYDYLDRLVRTENSDGSFSEHSYASGISLAPQYQDWIAGVQCPHSDTGRCVVDVELVVGTHYSDEVGKANVIIRDYAGLVRRTIDGEHVANPNATCNYGYDPFGRLQELRDDGNALTVFDYDAYGRLKTHVDPDVGSTTYTYNAFGEVKTSTDPNQEVRNFAYDRLGRLTSISDSAGTSTWIYDQGASARGRLSETISPPTNAAPTGQHVLYGYEATTATKHRGLPSSVTYVIDSTSYAVSTEYDDLARVRFVSYPVVGGGAPVRAHYHYQANSGALESVTENGAGPERPIWHLDSAFQGYLAQQTTFGNGAVSTFGYDSARRWLSSVHTTLANDTIQDLEYTHYGNGQVHERLTSNRTQEYQYDPLGRIKSLTNFGAGLSTVPHLFGYDDHGNLAQNDTLTNHYPAGSPHLPDHVGANDYGYRPNGNLLSRVGPDVPGGIQTILYTPFDLPKQVATGTAPFRLTQFEYTADEERVVRRDSAAETSRHFVGNLYQRLVSSSSGATLEQRFRIPAGGGVAAEIVRTSDSERILFFHPDHLGTPDAISDGGGDVIHQEYDPFGALVGAPPGVNQDPTRVGFTGQQQDNDLGLVDMGGRVYDPLAGRFTTADPIMQAPFGSQGQNRYAYVFNDPINLTDPSGFITTGSTGGDIAAGATTGAAWGIVGYGIATEAANAGFSLAPAGGIAGSGLGSSLGVLASVGITLFVADPGAARAGGSATLPAPTAAPTSNAYKSGGANAVANSHGGPPVQERSPESFAAGPKASGPAPRDPLADRSRFAGAEYDINRRLFGPNQDRRAAAEIAVRFWGGRVNDVFFDSSIEDDAFISYYPETDAAAVTFGPKATTSARYLLSTAQHEAGTHLDQFRSFNRGNPGTEGFYVNEVEALDRELEMSRRLGLSDSEISQITGYRSYYYGKLSPGYQTRVDAGNYTVR